MKDILRWIAVIPASLAIHFLVYMLAILTSSAITLGTTYMSGLFFECAGNIAGSSAMCYAAYHIAPNHKKLAVIIVTAMLIACSIFCEVCYFSSYSASEHAGIILGVVIYICTCLATCKYGEKL